MSSAAASPAHFRAMARRPVSLPARIADERNATAWAARLVDLGLGGACVELAEPLSEGVRVKLLIDAPHLWDPLELEAKVAWSRAGAGTTPNRAGVRFESVSGTTLRLLAELLEAEAYGA
jgi:hypothetical protein